MSAKMELANLLSAVIKNEPGMIDCLPVNATFIDGARQNDSRPAWIRMAVPDGWMVNLTKNEKLLDGFILCRVDREFIEGHMATRIASKESENGNEEILRSDDEDGREDLSGRLSAESGVSGGVDSGSGSETVDGVSVSASA